MGMEYLNRITQKNLEACLEMLNKKRDGYQPSIKTASDSPNCGSLAYEKNCFDCKLNQDRFCPLADMYLSLRPRFCEAFTPRSQQLVVSIATVAKARRIERKRRRRHDTR